MIKCESCSPTSKELMFHCTEYMNLSRPTLQVATILVAMAPKILKPRLDLQKILPKPKELVAKWSPSKNFNLEG